MYQIEIIRSNRKSISLQIKSADKLIVRAPYRVSEREIQQMICSHKEWIDKHMKLARERKCVESATYSAEEMENMRQQAKETIPPLVEKYAKQAGVSYGKIFIKCQKTRWGSCSAQGNLNFNLLLMQTPQRVLEYVIVHELCHRKEMNHSRKFWEQVEKVMPDYKERRAWLKKHGGEIIRRCPRD